MENLETLIKEYQSEKLFRHLSKWNNPEEVNICSLYDTFSTWLLVKELRCEAIVEIILVLYKYLKPSEKIDLLNRWIRVPSVQSWIIMRALSYPLCLEPDISKLLQMQEVKDHLIQCARQASNGIYKENLIILQKCFFQTEDGQNTLIDAVTCGKIVEIMCEPLTDEARITQMDQCGSFLAQVLPVICNDSETKALQQKIFLTLFEFSVKRDFSEDLSEDTLWEVTTAWQEALSSNDLEIDDFLLNSCARIVNEKILATSMEKMTISNMERLTEIVAKLILCSTEQKSSLEKSSTIDKLIGSLLDHSSANDHYIENLGLCVEQMHGGIVLTSIGDVPDEDFIAALDSYLKHKIFNLDVIIKLSCNIKRNDREIKETKEDDMEPGDENDFAELRNQTQEEEATEDYCDMDESLLKEWTDGLFDKFCDLCYGEATLNVILTNARGLNPELENWIIYMQERLGLLVKHLPDQIAAVMKEKLFEMANVRGGIWAKCLMNLMQAKSYSSDTGAILLYEDAVLHSNQDETVLNYINILQTFSEHVGKKALPITSNLFEKYSNMLVKVSASRSLMRNHLNVNDFNEIGDRKVVGNALIVMDDILTKQRAEPFLLYNKHVSLETQENVLLVAEIAHFVSDVLTYFPSEVDVKRWDFVRIALSSWVLSVSKSCHKFEDNQVKAFIVAIFKLNAAFFKFIISEKTKSSTQMLRNIIDEWEKNFAKEVNLVLIKSFINIVKNLGESSQLFKGFS